MELKNYDMHRKGGIDRWDEAMPLGNGRMGVLLYGTDHIRLAMDRVDLWDSRPAPATLEKGFHYENLKKLVNSGSDEDWKEFTRLFDTVYRDTAYPSKITAGRAELRFADAFVPEFHLALEDGVAQVRDEKGQLRLTGFASATEYVSVFRVNGKFKVELRAPAYMSSPEQEAPKQASICNPGKLGYPECQVIREDGFIYFRQETKTDFAYGVVVLQVDCGEWKELYCTITTNRDGEDHMTDAKQNLLKAAQIGYDTLLQDHRAWWKDYWAKSQICLDDPALEEAYYRFTYLFASCSRKGFYPMPLQGVWTADNDGLPPWKGDYHHDTNTQLSYQAYLKANRLPEGEVFLDYLWDLREAFTAYARDFFGVEGLLIPGVSTIEGIPMGGWGQYSMSPTMSIWTAQSFDEYYLYTGDEDFLRSRAYPFLTEVGKAIAGILEERDGRLYLPLSTSPEIHDNKRESYLQPNSNFDLALLRYLYQTLVGYAEKLEDAAAEARWQAVLSKLDPFAIDGRRILLAPGEELKHSHRHFSHLMCLYPLHLINYDTQENREIYEQAIVDLEMLGTGEWVGFSFAMMAQIHAMALQGNGAYRNLYSFAHGFVAENGFHLNGDFKHYGYVASHYRPFTLEACYGFCDALHEMLMQDHMGYVHVFPAIPNEWKEKEISFTDLRSRGGVLVSAKRGPNGLQQVRLKSQRACTVRLRNTFGREVLAEAGAAVQAEGDYLAISLPQAGEVLLTAKE